MSDNPDMTGDRHTLGVTEHVVYQGDVAVYNSTRNRAYINGTLTYDVVA